MPQTKKRVQEARHLRLDAAVDEELGVALLSEEDGGRRPYCQPHHDCLWTPPPSRTTKNNINNDQTQNSDDDNGRGARPLRSRRGVPFSSSSFSSSSSSSSQLPVSIHHRILDRDAAFYQSRGRWRVQHISRDAARHYYLGPRQNTTHHGSHQQRRRRSQRRLGLRKKQGMVQQFWNDWFYFLAYQRTVVLVLILFLSYSTIIIFFAFAYYGASYLGQHQTQTEHDHSKVTSMFCDLDIHNHMEALYLSISTMCSIGYGVSNYYFGGCWVPFVLVLCQVFSAITFDAVAIGLLFQRISRGQKRGKTIVFSNTAVIQRVHNQLYFMFRVGELRHHQLREATVRAYCVRHERHVSSTGVPVEAITGALPSEVQPPPRMETTHYVTRSIQLLHEKFGTDVLMSLPQVIVHRLDAGSPLYPSETWYDATGQRHETSRHIMEHDNNQQGQKQSFAAEQDQMNRFLCDREAEIIVLVEGTDELTGAVIQSRHSYTVHDLEWGHAFVSCILPCSVADDDALAAAAAADSLVRRHSTSSRPVCVVNFAAFHDTVPSVDNAESSPYIY